MSNKLKKKKTTSSQNHQDSVFKEAWQNMNEDMSSFMPEFITKRRLKGKGKVWVVVVVTLVELLILGVVGKFVYDWLVK
jgi:uncharacterized protein HemX